MSLKSEVDAFFSNIHVSWLKKVAKRLMELVKIKTKKNKQLKINIFLNLPLLLCICGKSDSIIF